MTFEEYWDSEGSRLHADTHEERARMAWDAAIELSEGQYADQNIQADFYEGPPVLIFPPNQKGN